jgi:hypothetical protein
MYARSESFLCPQAWVILLVQYLTVQVCAHSCLPSWLRYSLACSLAAVPLLAVHSGGRALHSLWTCRVLVRMTPHQNSHPVWGDHCPQRPGTRVQRSAPCCACEVVDTTVLRSCPPHRRSLLRCALFRGLSRCGRRHGAPPHGIRLFGVSPVDAANVLRRCL